MTINVGDEVKINWPGDYDGEIGTVLRGFTMGGKECLSVLVNGKDMLWYPENVKKIEKTTPQKSIDAHYDFFYELSMAETNLRQLKVDPYFVSKQWRVGERDPSGALFHILKTVARFGDKNPPEREIKAIYLQIKRLAELEGVELE